MEEGFSFVGNFSQNFQAPLNVVLDNFSEIERSFKVDKFIGANENNLQTVDFSVSIEEEKTKGFSFGKYRSNRLYFANSLELKKEIIIIMIGPLNSTLYRNHTETIGLIKEDAKSVQMNLLSLLFSPPRQQIM